MRLGDYYAIEELGKGGQGTTWLAKHIDTEDQVVVKVCPEEGLQEAETLASIARQPHRNVVRLRHSFDDDAGYCVVMDYVQGVSLAEMAKSGPYPLDQWWPTFKGILLGVDHIHRQGLIHQDLKPENIILSKGEPVIVDLGGARKLDGSETVYYTPGYEPWEVHSPLHSPGPFSDVFTLALVFSEVMFGRISNDKQGIERVRRQLGDKFGDFGASIARALQYDPKDRPQTITEWLAELVSVRSPIQDHEEESTRTALSSQTSRSTEGRFVAGGMTVRELLSDLTGKLGLPRDAVTILGPDGEEASNADLVLHVLMGSWQDWGVLEGFDEYSCSELRDQFATTFSLTVEFLNPNGEAANGNTYLRTLRQRFAEDGESTASYANGLPW